MIDHQSDMKLRYKLSHLNWGLIALVVLIACVGFMSLYSAAGGSLNDWATKQMIRFVVGAIGMIVIAMIEIRWWHRLSYVIYIAGFLMLIAVEIMGQVGMGAQRWINLGVIQLQPSELMKIAVVMALARYFHARELADIKRFRTLIFPSFLICLPIGLVMMQPDLGTSLMIGMAGAGIFWISGVSVWLFVGGIACVAAAAPIGWHFFMHDYQKQRVMTFLNPESDPLGSGYHITQSKIALGSGGFDGKGFLNGSQSHLNFLPEKQTDFIFTLWAEEWGFIGGLFVMGLYALVFLYCGWIALKGRQAYARILAFGLMINFSLYVFINIAMVMGLIPVVGVPLPLISYGGTSMLAALISIGLIMSCHLHRDTKIPRM